MAVVFGVVKLTCLPRACLEEVEVLAPSLAAGGDLGVGGQGEVEEACLRQEADRKEREKVEEVRDGTEEIQNTQSPAELTVSK